MRLYIFAATLLFLAIYTGCKIHTLIQKRIWITVLVTMFLMAASWTWLFIYRGRDGILDTNWYPPLMWTGSILLGLLGSFIIFSLVLDIAHFLFFTAQKIFPSENGADLDEVRRKFLFRSASFGALAGSAVTSGIGFHTARTSLQVKKVDVPIKNLPDSLKDLKIAQISDLHIGLTIGEDYVRRVVTQTMETGADMIVITGDLADGTPRGLETRWQPLKDLKARLGIYYITGNHEYYSGVEEWLKTTSSLGFTNLLNENRIIKEGDAKILIAGVTDQNGGNFFPDHKIDAKKAATTDQSCDLKILLAHQPDIYDEAEALGFDLQLSGHTHAGQFFPFSLLMVFAHKFYKGLSRHKNMWLYVNQGTGYWGTVNRFALPSEITLIGFSKEA